MIKRDDCTRHIVRYKLSGSDEIYDNEGLVIDNQDAHGNHLSYRGLYLVRSSGSYYSFYDGEE
jgi:hypothetical protein